jgi:Domain of unknown function (DUF4288)
MRTLGVGIGRGEESKRPRKGKEDRGSAEVRGLPQRSQAKDRSVSIWYAAHIVMYVTFKHGMQDYYPVWENIVLIKARSEHDAFAKAEKIGRDGEGDTDGSFRWEGRKARWGFGGVRKLVRCQDSDRRPGDQTEVTYQQFIVPTKEALDRLLDADAVMLTVDDEFANAAGSENGTPFISQKKAKSSARRNRSRIASRCAAGSDESP